MANFIQIGPLQQAVGRGQIYINICKSRGPLYLGMDLCLGKMLPPKELGLITEIEFDFT